MLSVVERGDDSQVTGKFLEGNSLEYSAGQYMWKVTRIPVAKWQYQLYIPILGVLCN